MFSQTTPVLQDYFALQYKYQNLYGDNTVVLFEIGSFFEVYQVEEWEIGKAKEVSDLLSIQLTRKDKNRDHGPRNPFMVGFPSHAVTKFINKLVLSHSYTVVKFVQEDILNSDKKNRVLEQIYSPGTYIDHETPSTNYIVGVVTEIIAGQKHASMSAIDLTTGKASVFSAYDSIEDHDRADNEIFRFIHSFNPSEVIFSGEKDETLSETYKLSNTAIHFRQIPPEYTKVDYQNSLLARVYSFARTSVLSPIEQISLEKYPDLVLSFVFLLQFAFEHSPTIIRRLAKPEIFSSKDTLILSHDSIYQLNLVNMDSNKGRLTSLNNLLDHTLTNIGKRLLRERLLFPITSKLELERRYDLIEKMIGCVSLFEPILREIVDIEKKARRAILKKLTPYEFAGLHLTYENVKQLLVVAKEKLGMKPSFESNFNTFCSEYSQTFDIPKMEDIYAINNIQKSIFHQGVFPEIDTIQSQIDEHYQYFKGLTFSYGEVADPRKSRDAVKLVFNEIEGHTLSTTKRRFERLKGFEEIEEVKGNGQTVKFTTKTLRERSQECRKLENEIGELVRKDYLKAVYKLYSSYRKVLRKVVTFVGEVDLAYASARSAQKYRYVRPKILDGNSRFEVKGLRHPLVERLIESEYITNDLALEESGVLLYGTNATGKSIFLKAVGVNIALAQAGFFVACRSLELAPYTLLFSKITSDDNLFRGQSTFVKEMGELRAILRGANESSLILSDELCSGTETLSATSILASTLLELSRKKSTFLFTTHLHGLVDLKEIRELARLSIYHFGVTIDNGEIIYDRTLRPGSGEKLYGLEIARALNLGSEFIRTAFAFRAELIGEKGVILDTKRSKYNKKVYMHACQKCGVEKPKEGYLETHHLNPQSQANECGIIDGRFHKDIADNLIVLCRKCHQGVHRGEIKVTN